VRRWRQPGDSGPAGARPRARPPLGERLIDADRVVAGRLLRVENADEYEPLGSIVFGLFGAKVVVPAAYNAELRVDSTLLGKAGSSVWITFFAPAAPASRSRATRRSGCCTAASMAAATVQ